MNKKLVIQINNGNCVGSTGKIIKTLSKEMEKFDYDTIVIYGRKSPITNDKSIKVSTELECYFHSFFSKLTGEQFAFSHFSSKKAIRNIKRLKPDIVHLHSINCHFINMYKLLEFLKKNKIPTVITLHAEFFYTGGCSHANLCDKYISGSCSKCSSYKGFLPNWLFNAAKFGMKKRIEIFKNFHYLKIVGVSDYFSNRAKTSFVFKNHDVSTIYNGIDTNIFFDRDVPIKYNAIFIVPDFNNKAKGGDEFLKIVKNTPKLKYCVVGKVQNNFKFPHNVDYVGYVKNQNKLAKLYSSSEYCLILSKNETFSMVVAESLCCGTKVVGYYSGGPEEICIKSYSTFFEYGDFKSISDYLNQNCGITFNKKNISKEACEKYSSFSFSKKYFDIYKELIKEKNNER